MAHDHDHAYGNLKTAFFLNLVFTVIEFVGGLLTNSVAIMADAVHDAGDCLSLATAWRLQKLSEKSGDAVFTFGYRRFSVLGALVTGLVLIGGIAYVLSEAVPRLQNPEAVQPAGMIWMAVAGIAFNGLAVLRVRKGTSLNERLVSWHLLEDVLGWVAVLAGAIIISVWNLPVVDPLLSIGLSLFVLWNVVRNLKQVFRVFLQAAPKEFDEAAFRDRVSKLRKVTAVHDVRSWSMDGEHHVLTLHLVMGPDAERKDIVAAKDSVRALAEKQGFVHVTTDVELEGEPCSTTEGPAKESPSPHSH